MKKISHGKRPLVPKPSIELPEDTTSVTPNVPLPIPNQSEIVKEVPPTMTTVKEQIRSIPLPATTTEQEDFTTAGQRKVNLIWEYTQAFIAIVVIIANMTAGVLYAFRGLEGDIPLVLSSSLFLVIGFYFSRTNHQSIGGVGKQPSQEYQGR